MDARTVNNLPPTATHGAVCCLMAIELSKKSWIVAVNVGQNQQPHRERLEGAA
jgi:transposase